MSSAVSSAALSTVCPRPRINGEDVISPPDLRILHYNDVYHVDPSSSEPVGGIARFQNVCNYYQRDESFSRLPRLITLFSGDAFNPSLESSVSKGAHMVPVLNNIGTDCACVGNHDFDFGIRQYRHLTERCKFSWLLANVLDPALGENVPLGGPNTKRTAMLTASNGVKIGLIGLGEREWLQTINSLPPDLIYKSASQTAIELVPKLREEGAEIIIALTHQREPNDNRLAEKIPEGLIDIILGGHDHYYNHKFINGTHVLRSGSDFKQLSYIEAWRKPDGGKGWDFGIVRRDIVSKIPEDVETVQVVRRLTESMRARLEKPIGYSMAPLDARFRTVRLRESNLGNFVCDLMRYYHQADCCLMAAGTIRGDQIYAPGVLRMKDIMSCFPFEDPVVVVRVTGEAILHALENSVCKYPALEGRFPQVSNIKFEFDPNLHPGSRVKWVKINNADLEPSKKYKLSTRGYMARGKDGYDSLLVQSEGGDAEELVNEENGVLISTILRQYFMSLRVIGKWKFWSPSLERQWDDINTSMQQSCSILQPKFPSSMAGKEPPSGSAAQSTANGIGRGDCDGEETPFEEESDDDEQPVSPVSPQVSRKIREVELIRKVMNKWWRLAGVNGNPTVCDEQREEELNVNWTKAIAPRLEGRIRITNTECS